MNDEYAKAVDLAKHLLRPHIFDGKFTQYSAEPTEFLYMLGIPIEQIEDDHERFRVSYRYPENTLKLLHLRSATDKGAFDILCRILASRLFRN